MSGDLLLPAWAEGQASAPRRTVSVGGTLRANRVLRHLTASYDAAGFGRDNERHWAAADGLSANAANSPEVRRRLRNRSRYECANNTYAGGLCRTLAGYVVGTGPRLQVRTGDRAARTRVQKLFNDWAEQVGLAHKLRTMRVSQAESGEAFAVLTTNPKVGPVQMDFRLIEADQVATPHMSLDLDRQHDVDGIEIDEHGNRVRYHVLKRHPGDTCASGLMPNEYDKIAAELVFHTFLATRPGQERGIPEIMAALPMFAMMRRYSLAVLAAAENAAAIAGVVYTDAPGDDGDEVEPLEEFDIDRGTWLTMPSGWKTSQFQAEQPTGTYAEAKREFLLEVARVMDVPYNIVAGTSERHNYSSGRLDHQGFYRRVRDERTSIERVVLNRLFFSWLDEAALIEGYLPEVYRSTQPVTIRWMWDGFGHVDPQKEATAEATRLANGTTTLESVYAQQGLDWHEQLQQRAEELRLLRELDIPLPPAVASADATESGGEEADR